MAGWLLLAVCAVVITVIVLLPEDDARYPRGRAVVFDIDVPDDFVPPDVSLFPVGPRCEHDWRQVDELVERAGVASVLQVCTRCVNARAIPTTAPLDARRAGGGPMSTRCGLCGKKATGLASIGSARYCHGDDDAEPTCYEQAQWADSAIHAHNAGYPIPLLEEPHQ